MAEIQIEEFTEQELSSSGIQDNLEEIKQTVEKLGLEGQTKFLNQEAKGTFPYRKITKEESNIYSILCSSRTELKSYGDSLIPLRVLQIAAHADSTGFFKTLYVLHPENGDMSDPILLGVHEEVRQESWGKNTITELYILARWGTVLEPLSKLRELAKQKAIDKIRTNLGEIKQKLDGALNSIESTATRYVNGELVNLSPSFYA